MGWIWKCCYVAEGRLETHHVSRLFLLFFLSHSNYYPQGTVEGV